MLARRIELTLGAAIVLAAGFGTGAWAGDPPEFAFVANNSSNTVSSFRINPFSGALDPVAGSPFATGLNPIAVAVVANRFVYVVNSPLNNHPAPYDPPTISAFSMDAAGVLTPIAGSPFTVVSGPGDLSAVAADPTGRFLYVTDPLYEKVRLFNIDPSTGALAQTLGPFPLGNNAAAPACHPSGKYLYAGAYLDGTYDGISAYVIDPPTGAVTRLPGTPVPSGDWPRGAAVDPSGKYLYVANASSDTVSSYAVAPGTGFPTAIGAPVGAGDFPTAVAVTASRRFVYVANYSSSSISAYLLDGATGALTPVAGSPFPTGPSLEGVIVDPTGQFVYVTSDFAGGVYAHRILGTPAGALAPVFGSPFVSGGGPSGIASTNHDHVLADNFEKGTLAAWTEASTDNGDLGVTAEAALEGSLGLSALVNDTNPLFVRDNHPEGMDHYRARFLLDPSQFDPGVAQGHYRARVLIASREATSRRVVTLVLKLRDGQYSLAGRVLLDDGTREDTPFVPLAPGPHAIQFNWVRSDDPLADAGYFELFVDDVSRATLSVLDNDVNPVDSVRLGAMGLKTGASGKIFFDGFGSNRYNWVWP